MQRRREILLEQLENEAGEDPLKDRFKVGYIAACNDLLKMTVEEVEIKEID